MRNYQSIYCYSASVCVGVVSSGTTTDSGSVSIITSLIFSVGSPDTSVGVSLVSIETSGATSFVGRDGGGSFDVELACWSGKMGNFGSLGSLASKLGEGDSGNSRAFAVPAEGSSELNAFVSHSPTDCFSVPFSEYTHYGSPLTPSKIII